MPPVSKNLLNSLIYKKFLKKIYITDGQYHSVIYVHVYASNAYNKINHEINNSKHKP